MDWSEPSGNANDYADTVVVVLVSDIICLLSQWLFGWLGLTELMYFMHAMNM